MSEEFKKEIEALKSQLEKSNDFRERLSRSFIRQAIRSNPLIRERTMNPEGVVNKLSEYFKITDNGGDIFQVSHDGSIMSADNPSREASTSEAVTYLLTGIHKNLLIPDNGSKENKEEKVQQPQNSNISLLLAQYNTAKSKRDGLTMVRLKRQLHIAGHKIL